MVAKIMSGWYGLPGSFSGCCMSVTTEPRGADHVGPNDPTHRAVNDVVRGILNDVVVPAARRQLRDALDRADAAKPGKLAGGVHRAPDSKAFGL